MSHKVVYSSDSESDSDVEQVVYVKKSRKKTVDPPEPPPEKVMRSRKSVAETNIEPVESAETNVEPVKKPRKARAPLSEDQKQVLRDRLASARQAKAIKRGVPQAEPVVEAIVSKPKRVSKKSVLIAEPETPKPKRASKKTEPEPETPPAKPKRVYKKKTPPVNPF